MTFEKYKRIRRGRGSKLWAEKPAGGKARGLPRQIKTNMHGVAKRQDAGKIQEERWGQV